MHKPYNIRNAQMTNSTTSANNMAVIIIKTNKSFNVTLGGNLIDLPNIVGQADDLRQREDTTSDDESNVQTLLSAVVLQCLVYIHRKCSLKESFTSDART